MLLSEYITRRNAILLDMDVAKMKELGREAKIDLPEIDFYVLAGMHIARARSKAFTEKDKAKSIQWLKNNNFPNYKDYPNKI